MWQTNQLYPARTVHLSPKSCRYKSRQLMCIFTKKVFPFYLKTKNKKTNKKFCRELLPNTSLTDSIYMGVPLKPILNMLF